MEKESLLKNFGKSSGLLEYFLGSFILCSKWIGVV